MLSVAQAMVNRSRADPVSGAPTSLQDLGYNDVGLDDNWQACGNYPPNNWTFHNASGYPQINTERFPSLADMVAGMHALNLTAGFYMNNCICSDSCNATECFVGDVATAVAAGFDSVKLDGCSHEKNISLWYQTFTAAGHQVMTENCHNGPNRPWGTSYADAAGCPFHMYRASGDIQRSFGSVVSNLQSIWPLAAANLSGPGCWAYADMLQVGNVANMNFTANRAHFGAWCITSNPLVLGLDVTIGPAVDAVWPILANREALDINSAWAGFPGTAFATSNTSVTIDGKAGLPAWQMLYKPLAGGATAVLVMNNGNATLTGASVTFADVPSLSPAGTYAVRDVWAHTNNGSATGAWPVPAVAPQDSVFVKLSPA